MENGEPVSISEPRPRIFIFDLGENIAGWVRLRVKAKRGTKVRLRFGEMLEADGTLHTENLRSARATDTYICRGKGVEEWEPRFTYHGFRYVEVSGLPRNPRRDTISSRVIYSAMPETGNFRCSDRLINRLQSCIVRSQKGNFVDLPTDCPQRDERLGWSGDAQVFAPTACYNFESGPVFRSWMRALRDGQREDGAFPDLAPHILLEHGNAGWGDAGIIVPWTVWQWSGDTRILEENYAAMSRHMEFQRRTSRRLIRPETLFGDWLAMDAERDGKSATPKDLIGTAYFARTAWLMSDVAGALGEEGDARRWKSLFEKIRAAFQREFVDRDGNVAGNTQTSYLLALGFDLLPESLCEAAASRLVELLEARAWRLSTGFLGTPLLCPVLSACGRTDVAYRLLQQRNFPSWLYPILNGATTMWERWDSWTKEAGFSKSGMTSFNHYAYGAIGEWLFGNIAGLEPAAPGFRRLRFAPEMGGGLSWARAEIRTPYGLAASHWRMAKRRFALQVVVPPNTEAEVRIPNVGPVSESGRPLARGDGILEVRTERGAAVVSVGSGKYCFRWPAPA
jgi:alpha-L-rhamnosidase